MYYQELIEFDSVNTADSQLDKDGFGIFQLPAADRREGRPHDPRRPLPRAT